MHSWGVGGLNVFISIRPDVFEVVPRENLRIELQCTVSLSKGIGPLLPGGGATLRTLTSLGGGV